MASTRFFLTTRWSFAAPPEMVWDALIHVDEWPKWWPGVSTEMLEEGDENGIGAYYRFTWRTALPYSLTFNMRAIKIQECAELEGRADGELAGTGRWTLTRDGHGTYVRFDWFVEVTRRWMRLTAPLLRRVFIWNHDQLMERGRRGLLQKIAAAQQA